MAASLVCGKTQYRVSSVLNRDVRQFGKKFMFDSNEETCWNSDQSVRVSELKVQFQGGFSAKTCRMEGCSVDEDFKVISHFYPEDNNSLQISFITAVYIKLYSLHYYFLFLLEMTLGLEAAYTLD
ncbi:nuclear receptor 2C2-associated protein isoform X1 [Phyllopteryx taeniolatus]|uniref:nuclear receptor 2C2-associated protein isoform X1 n=1 Tax=Phyllopteryx taeniolatus TaxID=161469 RepID=UPI002AD205FD|nr:nuclear receptor 2C2-associated protein isoform X1 [Phyllopteryx taeniolatus]